MGVMGKRRLSGILVGLAALAVGAACDSSSEPGANPAADVTGGVRGAGGILRSFTATPAAITEGEPFTLAWQGENGTVSLALKGSAPFVTGLPSTGQRIVSAGAAGYPAAPGTVVYVATIGDVANKREATLVVAAPAAPTPEPRACPNGTCDAGEDCATCPQDCGCKSSAQPHCCNGECRACCNSSHCGGCQVCAAQGTCAAVSCAACSSCNGNHGCSADCDSSHCCNGSCCSGDCCGGSCCDGGRCCNNTCYADADCCSDSDCDTSCWTRGDGQALTRFCNAANNHRCQDVFCSSLNGSWDSCCDGGCSADPCP